MHMHHIPVDALTGLVRDVFLAAGCDVAEADRIATHLVGANLAGHDSHGVVRVPRYVEWLEAGFVVKGQTADIVTDGGAFALVDGKWGFGQTVAPQAVALGIARAQQHGVSVTALRNAGHIGRVGDYAEQAIAAGLISMHFVNVAGSVLVAPFGGVERRFSTNPVAIGVPLPPRNPANGQGAIRAFGEHKGSGLAFMCEMLAGCLTAGGTSGPVSGRGRIANGMLSVFLSPAHFGTREEFERMGLAYADWIAACRPADAAAPVLLPGDPEQQRRAERTAQGVPLPDETWSNILATATRLGVKSPA